ncbi:MAG: RNA polymerase sigma factor [Congregibacter sp.]
MSVTDEDALLRAAQKGDAAAFETLLERHYDTMYRFAYKWCGSPADAQDITQQACMKLASSLPQFRFESAFTSWLYRLVVNCARDWARSQARHTSTIDTPADDQSTDGGAVEQQAFFWELLQQLDALPVGIKETLLLVHAEGLSHAETAAVLGVKESTVSWRLHEFRKQHRLALEEDS